MEKYIFIDESGDPVFYGRHKRLLVGTEGFQPYLIIGMIETENRRALRRSVVNFMNNIKDDPLYGTIPSVATDKGWYVHASSDHPEIRAKFFELIRKHKGYKAHVIVAKKDLNIFNQRYNSNPTDFYFDILHHLLSGKLLDQDCSYNLYLSQRGNNSLHRFEKAVTATLKSNISGNKIVEKYRMKVVPANKMPELSIIDYLMWAVQRKLLAGEDRFFNAARNKFATITNLYGEDIK